jgi:hypothetical protein
MHGDALCHVFDASIRRHAGARMKHLEIVAYAPLAGRRLLINVDKTVNEQHWFAMQHEGPGGHTDH